MDYKEESIRKTLAKNFQTYEGADAGFYELQNALDWVMNAPERAWENRTFAAIHASQKGYDRDELYNWVFKGKFPEAPKPTAEELKARRDETREALFAEVERVKTMTTEELEKEIASAQQRLFNRPDNSEANTANHRENLDSSEDEIKEGEITPEQLKAIEELEEAIKDVSIKTATQCFLAVLLREARKRGGCFDHATMKFGEFTIEVKHNEP